MVGKLQRCGPSGRAQRKWMGTLNSFPINSLRKSGLDRKVVG